MKWCWVAYVPVEGQLTATKQSSPNSRLVRRAQKDVSASVTWSLFHRSLSFDAWFLFQDPHNELKGKNVLLVQYSLELTAARFGLGLEQLKMLLAKSREQLYKARGQRPRPHLDTKMLASWNGEFSLVGSFPLTSVTCVHVHLHMEQCTQPYVKVIAQPQAPVKQISSNRRGIRDRAKLNGKMLLTAPFPPLS